MLEGEERFVLSLLITDNLAVISPISGDINVIVLPNNGASGTISIDRGMYEKS